MKLTLKKFGTVLLAAMLLFTASGVGTHFAAQAAALSGTGAENVGGEGETREKIPLRHEIGPTKPLHLITWYDNDSAAKQPEEFYPDMTEAEKSGQKEESLVSLWSSVPEDLKDNTIVIIIGNNQLNAAQAPLTKAYFKESAELCEENGIPFFIQPVNGETRVDWRLDVSYFAEFAENYEMFMGINAAELYNGESWRGDQYGDQSQYVADVINTLAEYGCIFNWTDTNIFGKDGTILDWIQENENLYDALKNHSENVVMQNKQSYADPSTDAVMLGLWLAGLIGHWGVASDWWYRQVNNMYGSPLFNEGNAIGGTYIWEAIMNYPEAQYGMDMLRAMSAGALCYKQEAQYYSTSAYGTRLSAYEYVAAPMIRAIESGRIRVPGREEVLASVKSAYIGREAYEEFNYGTRSGPTGGKVYPQDGRYGIIPLLPSNLRTEERRLLEANGIRLVTERMGEEYYEQIYERKVISGDTYAANVGSGWYFLNWLDNRRGEKYAEMAPRVNGASSFKLTMEEYGFGYVNELPDKLEFTLNNYIAERRVMSDTESLRDNDGGRVKAANWYWFGVRPQGEDGAVGVRADDSLAAMGRATVVEIKGTKTKPVVTFRNAEDGSGENNRPYEWEEAWDDDAKAYTLTVTHNGRVEFDVTTDGNAAYRKTVTDKNGASVGELNDLNDATSKTVAGGDSFVADLASVYEIRGLALSLTGTAGIDVWVSYDGAYWSRIAENVGADRNFDGVSGRYVKLEVKSAAEGAAIREFAVHGAAVFSPKNTLKGKLVEAADKAADTAYTQGTRAVVTGAVAYANRCLAEEDAGSYALAAEALTSAIAALQTEEGATATTLITPSVTALELPISEGGKYIEITGFNAGAGDKLVTWSVVSGGDVISLTEIYAHKVFIKPLKSGSATVRASAGGVSAEISITASAEKNVAAGKSARQVIGVGAGSLINLTDGNAATYAETGVGRSGVEVDLGGQYKLKSLRLLALAQNGGNKGAVILASSQPYTAENWDCAVIYNGDTDDAFGFGAGTDPENYGANDNRNTYFDLTLERYRGDFGDKTYRYVVFASKGNLYHLSLGGDWIQNAPNQYTELEVNAEIELQAETAPDYTALEAAYAAANADYDRRQYTEYSWLNLTKALSKARVMLAERELGGVFTQAQIDSAAAALAASGEQLVDCGSLRAAIEGAGELDISLFTEASAADVKNLLERLATAEKAMRAPSLYYTDGDVAKPVLVTDHFQYNPRIANYDKAYAQKKQSELNAVFAALDNLPQENVQLKAQAALNGYLEQLEDLKAEDYLAPQWSAYAEKLAAARGALEKFETQKLTSGTFAADAAASAAEIAAATEALREARTALLGVYYGPLVQKLEGKLSNADGKYTADSYSFYETVMQAVQDSVARRTDSRAEVAGLEILLRLAEEELTPAETAPRIEEADDSRGLAVAGVTLGAIALAGVLACVALLAAKLRSNRK